MNRLLFLLILVLIPINNHAQKKELTLEDLIPGGATYNKFVAKLPFQVQWYDEEHYTMFNQDTIYIVDAKSPQKKNVLVTREELRKLLSDDKASLNAVSFLKPADTPIGSIVLKDGDNSKRVFFSIENKKIMLELQQDKQWENLDFCDRNGHLAFTIDNNLFITKDHSQIKITSDEDKSIINGQAVHRNEFGINKGTFWSPKGNYLAFYRMDESMVGDYPLVDISDREAKLKSMKYPMAGMKSHEVTVGIYNMNNGKTVFLSTGAPKDRYFTSLTWSPDERFLYIAELNRGQDTCMLNCYDVQSGMKKLTLFQETDKHYVEPQHPLLFFKHSPDKFVWQSRRDGYNQLFLYDTNGKLIKKLTPVKADVMDVLGFDEKEEWLYFMSNEQNPIETQIYKTNINTGKKIQLTSEPGVHSSVLSLSGSYLLDRYSNQQTPLNMDLINTAKCTITSLQKAENPYTGYKLPKVTLGSIKAADGVTDLYYHLVKPLNFDASKKYPVVVYVYGGPHSQMIRNTWMNARGWDIYMAQKGYIVFSLDNRGTSNRGTAFETVIHRNLGTNETADQMKGVEFLKSLPYVDASRMGVHGWSYGGFMTTNMILRHPETFKVAVAGGPVIDWKYYEIMYGERYMDSPQENEKGYEDVNLNNLAGNLQGHLLLIHGDEDPTVVWQNSLSFLKACIKARTYPDYFVYPGHGHNMSGADRVHLHEKITRYFDDYLK